MLFNCAFQLLTNIRILEAKLQTKTELKTPSISDFICIHNKKKYIDLGTKSQVYELSWV